MDREQDIPFVYENGVLKPEGVVDLPEGTRGIARLRSGVPPILPDAHRPTESFWRGKSVDELAIEQGVKPIQSIDELRGDWPPEDSIDEFLEFLRETRK